jgi:hypothetical protein
MCFSFIKRFYFDRLNITYPKGIGILVTQKERVHNNEPIQGLTVITFYIQLNNQINYV